MRVLLKLLFFLVLVCRGSGFNVVGYLPEWRYEGFDFDNAAKKLTHLILFSLEPSATGEILALDRLPRNKLLLDARGSFKKAQKKLMVGFGGNGRSAGFSLMTRSQGFVRFDYNCFDNLLIIKLQDKSLLIM